jgi:hypothetical protein
MHLYMLNWITLLAKCVFELLTYRIKITSRQSLCQNFFVETNVGVNLKIMEKSSFDNHFDKFKFDADTD